MNRLLFFAILSVCLLTASYCLSRKIVIPAAVTPANITLTDRFYQINRNQAFWLLPDEQSIRKTARLVRVIGSADTLGLNPVLYRIERLKTLTANMPVAGSLLQADREITDIAITFFKALDRGEQIRKWISYDGISARYAAADDQRLLQQLLQVESAEGVDSLIQALQPATETYRLMKAELAACIDDRQTSRIKQLTTSLNYYRWIFHFRLDSFIVINIPSATLQYYKHDSAGLTMRAVVGTPYTRTPRFAAYCTAVTLYPYWNVPRSIAVKELLPMIRKKPGVLKMMSMEVLDAKGQPVDPATIPWSSLHAGNFPYRIREVPGCFNPLGVIRFTLNSPYDVYMHDTNFKGAFLSNNRFYSHGCIRVDDPISLANALLSEPVDTAFLRACYQGVSPNVQMILNPVPVFVVYMTATGDEKGTVTYFKDIYKLLD